jgi:hypothetical protein
MSIPRREFFAILGITFSSTGDLLAQHEHAVALATPDFENYQPQAFTLPEYKLVTALSECLLPADETGPGAREAHIAYYIDIVLKHAPAAHLAKWKSGLAAVQSLSKQKSGKDFESCSSAEQQQVMGALSTNELKPAVPLDFFFIDFKRLTIDAFYASELIQRKHLGYRGNTALAEFAGCTHKNFEHNSD